MRYRIDEVGEPEAELPHRIILARTLDPNTTLLGRGIRIRVIKSGFSELYSATPIQYRVMKIIYSLFTN